MYIYSKFQYIGMHICHNYSSSTISLSLGGKYMKLKQLLFICRRQFSNQSVPNTVELDMTLQIVKTNRHADFNLKKCRLEVISFQVLQIYQAKAQLTGRIVVR